jgi:hypothetical protein
MLVMACTPPVELNPVRIISLNHAVLITFEARPGREAKLCEENNRYFGIGRGKVFSLEHQMRNSFPSGGNLQVACRSPDVSCIAVTL